MVFVDTSSTSKEEQHKGDAVLLFFEIAKNFEEHSALVYGGVNIKVLQSIFQTLLKQVTQDSRGEDEMLRLFNEIRSRCDFDKVSAAQLAFFNAFNVLKASTVIEGYETVASYLQKNAGLEILKPVVRPEGVAEETTNEENSSDKVWQIFYYDLKNPDSKILQFLQPDLSQKEVDRSVGSLIEMSRGIALDPEDKKINCPASKVMLCFMKEVDQFFKNYQAIEINQNSLRRIYEKLFLLSATSEEPEDPVVKERYAEIKRYCEKEATPITKAVVLKLFEVPSPAPQNSQTNSILNQQHISSDGRG